MRRRVIYHTISFNLLMESILYAVLCIKPDRLVILYFGAPFTFITYKPWITYAFFSIIIIIPSDSVSFTSRVASKFYAYYRLKKFKDGKWGEGLAKSQQLAIKNELSKFHRNINTLSDYVYGFLFMMGFVAVYQWIGINCNAIMIIVNLAIFTSLCKLECDTAIMTHIMIM